MINGFLRIASVAPEHRVADVDFNVERIIESMRELDRKGVEIAVYPELCITGYTCGDMFHNEMLLSAAQNGLARIVEASKELNICPVVGLPVRRGGLAVYNCAALVDKGQVQFVDKSYLPTYNEFYETRWFTPASRSEGLPPMVFDCHGAKIGIEICEDLWVAIPPSCRQALAGAQVIFNLSASDDLIGKYDYLKSLIVQQSGRCQAAYAYSSAGFGESTTDLVFLPKTLIAERGTLLVENNREDYLKHPAVIADVDIEAIDRDRSHANTFADCSRRNYCLDFATGSENDQFDISWNLAYRHVSPMPFVPAEGHILNSRCREISTIQQCGLARRLKAVGSCRLVVGISGGLDSTLALLVAVATVKSLGGDPKEILGVTMPGFGTTDRTYDNAMKLMELLGVTVNEISIADAVLQHFKDIGHDVDNHDVTYENSQARERTQILMDLANQAGALVLGTGDLSELALGWATYNGDHMSMYGVNAGVPKTLVKYLVRWYASTASSDALRETLLDIVDTPISPELTPADEHGNIAQKTEELVGPYELHDFFLYYMLRFGFRPRRVFFLALKAFDGKYDRATILKWIKTFYRRFFNQQFKRSCLPDGPKVGSVCLSPRGDWRMPSDATSTIWLKEIDELNI
ncbi:MAG: NAD(+) synthase [Bacteroides sp.]|nr:NAD(+) synthase [Bacteroides sp.]MCM1413188.1 NAD(+) synthase [Bacteroides sp.]MCM1472070.1 NAD(+) synthase [Bacteroides sp.]